MEVTELPLASRSKIVFCFLIKEASFYISTHSHRCYHKLFSNCTHILILKQINIEPLKRSKPNESTTQFSVIVSSVPWRPSCWQVGSRESWESTGSRVSSASRHLAVKTGDIYIRAWLRNDHV